MRLRILHVNDVHSHFEELASIASAMEGLKDDRTLILDAGDNADFARLETQGTKGEISSAILNEMGFKARVFGNNEGFAGMENSKHISKTSQLPVVTCNMYDLRGKKLDFLEDAIALNLAGIKILIIGVTAPINVFYTLFGIYVKDPESEIQRVLAEKRAEGYDLVIVLSHLGLNGDRKLALKIRAIDIIVRGHSHTKLRGPLNVNETIICQAGDMGKYLGELVIDYDVASETIQSFKGKLIPSRKYPQHPKIMKLIEHYSRLAGKNLSVRLYTVKTFFDERESHWKPARRCLERHDENRNRAHQQWSL
jgi:5'-nucleotidase